MSRFRVHFKHGLISRIVSACRYESLDPDSNRIPNFFSLCVWIRIRTVFQIVFHFGLDPDSNRYPNYSVMLGVRIRIRIVFPFTSSLLFWIRIRTVIQIILFHYEVWIRIRTVIHFLLLTMCFGSGFEPFSNQASQLRVFFVTIQARAYFKPHVLIFYVIFSGPGSGFSHHFFL